MSLELDVWTQGFPEINVVVDFSINSKDDGTILTEQRLGSSVCEISIDEIGGSGEGRITVTHRHRRLPAAHGR